MLAHYRAVASLVLGFVLVGLVTACGGSEPDEGTAPAPLVIGNRGIGIAEIGEPPGAVIDELTSRIGAPDADSGWIDGDSPLYGECPAAQMRAAGWGSLYVFFVADEEVTAENEHMVGRFFTYSYGYDFSRNEGGTDPRELELATETGIGLGSTRAALRRAYGEALRESYDELTDIWTWEVDSSAATHLRGLLSGPDDAAAVTLIELGPACGDV